MTEPAPIDPREWTEIDAFAVRTRSILTASKIALHVRKRCRRTRQCGTFDGIEWMCLAIFRERLEEQQRARARLTITEIDAEFGTDNASSLEALAAMQRALRKVFGE